MARLLVVILLALSSMPASAFWDHHAVGWHWYELLSSRMAEKDASVLDPKSKTEAEKDPSKTIAALQEKVTKALHQAIVEPTPENIQAYIQLQNAVAEMSSVFALKWQEVIFKNPRLNHALKEPTNALGKEVHLDNAKKQMQISVEKFAEKYGLLFFFRSDCPYCHRFAPLMKQFATKYQLTLFPITLDDQPIAAFPKAKKDNGIANKLGVDVVPAVFAIEPKQNEAHVLSYGLVSEETLLERIHALMEGSQS